jgi:CBS domain-containing protein
MEARNAGSLVVTDEEDRIGGIVTDRDFALALAHHDNPATGVDAVMSSNVATIREDATLVDAAAAMDSRGVRRLPGHRRARTPSGSSASTTCIDT